MNYIADQTVGSLASALKDIKAAEPSSFAKCGMENRTFFDNTDAFSLGCVCGQIEEAMLSLIEKEKENASIDGRDSK